MGHPGDVIVVCVDHANDVWKELQRRQHGGASVREAGPGGGNGTATEDEVDEMDEMVALEVDR
jgi:hypothetical protein